MIQKFISNFKGAGFVPHRRDEQVIKREPQLFSCDLKHASMRLGGPLTREILSMLELSEFEDLDGAARPGYTWIVDTRVHMLKPGFYPAIPGWHCDAVMRNKETGQPDLANAPLDCRHYTCILESAPQTSWTEFLIADIEINVDRQNVWKSVSKAINKDPATLRQRMSIPPGSIIEFDSQTLHRATETVNAGWRYFFRASEMLSVPRNEIRTQTQVYADLNGGW